MASNPLKQLIECGQAVWLDYLSRDLLQSGELARLVREDGLRGMTSNPTIFHDAMTKGSTYDDAIVGLAKAGKTAPGIFESLAIEDVRDACDVMRSVYEATDGADGFVSLEVSPHLAHDTAGTIAEAHRLWAGVDRPNVMIKVPAMPEGLPAIEQLLTDGLNINITLIFGQPVYRQVAEAYLKALETRRDAGAPVDRIASVASTFVSRIDTEVDARLEKLAKSSSKAASRALEIQGKAAIANSTAVYVAFQEIFDSERFRKLAAQGARVQRPLWASTSTKNPKFSPTMYVEALVARDTVNTMPQSTIDAFRKAGVVRPDAILADAESWVAVLDQLKAIGVDLDDVMSKLETEGVQKFTDSYDALLQDLEKKAMALAH